MTILLEVNNVSIFHKLQIYNKKEHLFRKYVKAAIYIFILILLILK